jgi:hypothetical protein
MSQKGTGNSIALGSRQDGALAFCRLGRSPSKRLDPQQLRRNCEAFLKSCPASEKTVQPQATCDICRETLPRMKQVAAGGALWLMNLLQRFAAPGLLLWPVKGCGAPSAPASR